MKIDDLKQWYIDNEKLYFASIELTQNCNFKCKHCYCTGKNDKCLSADNCIKIIDKLYDAGCLFLNLTGGEIFTHKEFEKIYLYAKNKGFIIDLLTNASLIDKKIINLFKQFPPNTIAVTLYGTNEKEYFDFTGNCNNYHKVMTALDLLYDNNIHFVLRTVATKSLRASLLNNGFEKIANKYHTTFSYDPILFPKLSGEEKPLDERLDVKQIIEIESKYKMQKELWTKKIQEPDKNKKMMWSCHAGINSMAIDYHGNAYVCGLYRTSPISILKNEIEEVLIHLKMIHQNHIEIVKKNECNKCENRDICKWCPAYAYIFNHSDDKRIDFFCQLAEARVKYYGGEFENCRNNRDNR